MARASFNILIPISSIPTVSGTTNFIPEFTGPNSIGNSSLIDTNGIIFGGTNLGSRTFSNTKFVITSVLNGVEETQNIGIFAEAQGTSTGDSAGVYGHGWTYPGLIAGGLSAGITGEGRVTNSTDVSSAIGVRGYSNNTHSGGFNIALFGNATGSSTGNYALYMAAGNIYSNVAQTWRLASSTSALNIASNLMIFDTANNRVGINAVPTSTFFVSGSSTGSTPTMVVREGVVSPVGGVGVFDVQNSAGTSIFFVSGSGVSIFAGQVRAIGTAASAPAFTGADSDTGVYFPAANQMRFATNGTFSAAVDSSQNWGFGTVTPSTRKVTIQSNTPLRMGTATEYWDFIQNTTNVWAFISNNSVYSIYFENTTGAIGAGAVPTAGAGSGIKLPAAPNNSDVQTLDCYYENTWTPTVTFGTGGSVSYTVDNAQYVRVGRLVTISAQISYTVTSAPTGGDLSITVPVASAFNQYFGTGNFNSLGGGTTQGPLYLILGASSTCLIRKASATAGVTIANQITTSSTFIVTGTYFT